MKILMLGDCSERLLKSCKKHGYQFTTLSKLLALTFLQDDYTPFKQFGKEESTLWKNYLFGANELVDSAKAEEQLAHLCTKIASFIDRSESLLVHLDYCDKNIINYLEKKITSKFTIVYHNSGSSEVVGDSSILDTLYSRPNLPYVFTKKSSIINIILELQSAATKRHPYSYRPYALGLDISMNSTGVACTGIDINGHVEILFGKVKTKRTKLDIQRLPQIKAGIKSAHVRNSLGVESVVDLRHASQVCVEGGALGAVQGAFRLGQYAGMFLVELCRSEVSKKFFYVAPSSLKKIITGYGRAAKGLMILKIKKTLKINQDINDDEADALCLLHCLIDPNISLKDENLT